MRIVKGILNVPKLKSPSKHSINLNSLKGHRNMIKSELAVYLFCGTLGFVHRVFSSARKGDVAFVLLMLKYHKSNYSFVKMILKETDTQKLNWERLLGILV